MRVRVKKINSDKIVKIEMKGAVKDILISEDILNPGSETVMVCFRGNNCSGIIDFSAKEIDEINSSVKNRLNLVRDVEELKETKRKR